MLSHNIAGLYFGYRPVAGHGPDCTRAAADTWEATRNVRDSFDGLTREITFRFACRECGAVHFETFDGPAARTETTSASQVGYGSAPVKVAGLWLHPGPRFYYDDERGPETWYATLTPGLPREPAGVAGILGWHLTRRRSIRWSAGTGLTEHGSVLTPADQEFTSRRAAAAWIAARLAGDGQ